MSPNYLFTHFIDSMWNTVAYRTQGWVVLMGVVKVKRKCPQWQKQENYSWQMLSTEIDTGISPIHCCPIFCGIFTQLPVDVFIYNKCKIPVHLYPIFKHLCKFLKPFSKNLSENLFLLEGVSDYVIILLGFLFLALFSFWWYVEMLHLHIFINIQVENKYVHIKGSKNGKILFLGKIPQNLFWYTNIILFIYHNLVMNRHKHVF